MQYLNEKKRKKDLFHSIAVRIKWHKKHQLSAKHRGETQEVVFPRSRHRPGSGVSVDSHVKY